MNLPDDENPNKTPDGPLANLEFDPTELVDMPPGFDLSDVAIGSFYDEIRALETSEIDDYEPQGDEIAFYLTQPALARICRLSARPSKKGPVLVLHVTADGLTAIAGDSAVRTTIRENVLRFKPKPPDAPLRFNLDLNDVLAAQMGSDSTIRFVYSPGTSAVQVASGSFRRPLALLGKRTLPVLLDQKLQTDESTRVSVPSSKLAWGLRYLLPFAQLHDTYTDRIIQIKDGCLSAGSALHGSAGRVTAAKLRELDFSLHSDVAAHVPTVLDEAGDDTIFVVMAGSYVVFETERLELAVARSAACISAPIARVLDRTFETFDLTILSRETLSESLPRFVNEADLVRITSPDEHSFMFVISSQSGNQSQFKLSGRLRKTDPHKPNPDFRTSLPQLARALTVLKASNVFISSLPSGPIWIDDEHEEEPVRTILPMIPVDKKARPPRKQPVLQITAEEVVDDNY